MQTHPLHVADARSRLDSVRAELLAFTDVLDVFPTGRADVLVVICSGRPRPGEWVGALRAAGYRIPPRRHASDGSLAPAPNTADGTTPDGIHQSRNRSPRRNPCRGPSSTPVRLAIVRSYSG
jgi:hypothetical protein